MKKSPRPGFSARHPFIFGFSLLILVMALMWGAMAFFSGGLKNRVFSSEAIGVVNVDGMITDSVPVVRFIRRLRDDSSVKGVILRVNSPGGLIAPSQELYLAVKRCAEYKPVVASFGSVAASGGYYAAAPATIIVSNSGSLTGSIGVKAEYASIKGLMDKIGVKPEIITSGKFKAVGSPMKPLTPEQRKYLKSLIMDMHTQFVDDVAKARGMDRKDVEKVADGRALTGRQAHELGLVDKLGGYEDAVAYLKAECGIEGPAELIEGPKEDKSFVAEILGYLGIAPEGSLSGQRWQFTY